MITVMAIIVILMALLVPTISGMSSTAGRKGAVNILMNTFEQARVAAIEAGRPVYVIFARPDFPDQDAIQVVRETESGSGPYEQLTKWNRLPKGVLLHTPSAGESILTATNYADVFDMGRLAGPIPGNLSQPLSVLAFNETGAVDFPTAKANRKLIVSEGVRGTGGTEALLSQKAQGAGGFEIISLAKYTGRAQLDVTTVQ